MKLKVEVEDCIYVENQNGDQVLCIDMNYSMEEILQQLEKLVDYINKEHEK